MVKKSQSIIANGSLEKKSLNSHDKTPNLTIIQTNLFQLLTFWFNAILIFKLCWYYLCCLLRSNLVPFGKVFHWVQKLCFVQLETSCLGVTLWCDSRQLVNKTFFYFVNLLHFTTLSLTRSHLCNHHLLQCSMNTVHDMKRLCQYYFAILMKAIGELCS